MWSKTSCLTSFVQPIARLDDDPFLWAAEERQRVDELRTVFTTSQRGLPSHLLERGQREKWFAETVLFDLSSDREHNRQILLTLVSILVQYWKTRQSMIWLVKTWSPHHPYSKETGNRKGSTFCETPSKEQVITTTTKKSVAELAPYTTLIPVLSCTCFRKSLNGHTWKYGDNCFKGHRVWSLDSGSSHSMFSHKTSECQGHMLSELSIVGWPQCSLKICCSGNMR